MDLSYVHGHPVVPRIHLAAVCAALTLAALVPKAEAEGPSFPIGGEACIAFGHMLEGARHESRGNENFSIEQPERTLRYIAYATHDLELLEPVGGWSAAPSDVAEVRAAIATLGFEFRPMQWRTEPGEAMVVYYEDFSLDYDSDLAFERGQPDEPCSRFEFWRGDPATGALTPIPGPEGWEACDASSSKDQERFLVLLHAQIAVPMLVRGKGLGADFFIYRLKQAAPTEADAPQQRAAKPVGQGHGVPPFCRVRLERKVEVMTKGPELCDRFAKQVHDALYDRSYAIGEPADRLLTLLLSRGAALEMAWSDIPIGQTEETKAALRARGMASEQADRLLAATLPGMSRLWLGPRPDDGQPILALAQGRDSSDRTRTVLLRMTQEIISALEIPRALSPSGESRVSHTPISYEGRRLLLEIFPSGSSMDMGLTSLDPVERLCLFDVRDKDMVAAIDYAPNIRP